MATPRQSQHVKQRSQLMRELRKAESVKVVGVVDPSGPGGCKSQGERKWSLIFSLVAWRIGDGPVQRRELAVRKPVPERAIADGMERLKPYRVVRLRARVLEDNVMGKPHALLVRIMDTSARDTELKRIAKELQAPVTFDDKALGTFTLNRQVGWFEARTRWGSSPVRLTIDGSEREPPPRAIAEAKKLWRAQKTWNRRIVEYAASRALPPYNTNWRLEANEPEISAAEFAKRIKLESISVETDGRFSFWFQDDWLFGGHAIVIKGSVRKGPRGWNLLG